MLKWVGIACLRNIWWKLSFQSILNIWQTCVEMVKILYINIHHYNDWKVTKWRKKPFGQNKNLNFLHNPTNYKEVYEWDCDVLSQEFEGFRTLQQTLNFIPTPCVVMNELFCEPIEHNCFKMWYTCLHCTYTPCTQKTYQHCDKVDTWTSKEISNSHIVYFVI
jgi:hypothetical protein